MKHAFLFGGLVIVGWLIWQYFRKPSALESHLQSELQLQKLGATVNSVTTAATPINASIGVKPLTTVSLNPINAVPLSAQIAPIDLSMVYGNTSI